MSNASSKLPDQPVSPTSSSNIPWNPVLAVLFVVAIYFLSQIVGAIIIELYTLSKHWTTAEANSWLTGSVYAQFSYVLVAELFSIAAVYFFLKKYGRSWSSIGLRRPRLRDVGYGLLAAPVYYLIYFGTVVLASSLIPALNIDQEQQIGFNNVSGTLPLVVTFISLVILPPLTEEIMVRGLLFASLRKKLPLIAATIITSLIFASAHLPAGGAAGPLYIAALDTFVLSVVLIYLRLKTGSLWASITLHALKNGVAFYALFILHAK